MPFRLSDFSLICFGLLLALTGCASMYPGEFKAGQTLSEDQAIVLVVVEGPRSVDYIQLCHSGLPCLNYRFEPVTNHVLALPISLPKRSLHLGSYTFGSAPAGYIGTVSYGYHAVDDPKIDLTRPGLYYLLTLKTEQAGKFARAVSPDLRAKLRARYGVGVADLPPVNFNWPN